MRQSDKCALYLSTNENAIRVSLDKRLCRSLLTVLVKDMHACGWGSICLDCSLLCLMSYSGLTSLLTCCCVGDDGNVATADSWCERLVLTATTTQESDDDVTKSERMTWHASWMLKLCFNFVILRPWFQQTANKNRIRWFANPFQPLFSWKQYKDKVFNV